MKFYYDLEHCPPTYDTISTWGFLEGERVRLGASHVDVEFLVGRGFRKDKLWPYTEGERWSMLENVAVPLCRLLPSVRNITVNRGTPPARGLGVGRRFYGARRLVDAYQMGVRPLRAPNTITRGPLITITLREASHWPERNSQVYEWLKASRQLKDMGHPVVFVRDTALADEELFGATTVPAAATSIPARADLYASASLNLFVSNGPAWLSMMMDLPTLIFRPGTETSGKAFTRRFLEAHGLAWGGQMPNSPPYQRLVWQDDTADNIVAAVQEHYESRVAA